MQIIPLKTYLIKPNDDLVGAILQAAERQGIRLEDGDVLAVASKASVEGTRKMMTG